MPRSVPRPIWIHRYFSYCPICSGQHLQLSNGYMHVATRELFEEIVRICSMVPSDLVNGLILHDCWQQRWKKVKEDTSLSQSGLHFGHYIAGTDCDCISQFHVLKVLLALKKGIALERWSKGLSVMLEKMFGVRLVSKLRAILLWRQTSTQ